MPIPEEYQKEIAAFPAALRQLIEAELATGNEIAELAHGFPAAPCGASVKLVRAVAALRRKSAGEVVFYDRNNRDYAGEFTNAQRHFFVLEPPRPPEPPPDMNAIRAELEARERVADTDRFRAETLDAIRAKLEAQERAAKTSRFKAGTTGAKKRAKPRAPAKPARLPATETATCVKRVFHFRDQRPPHEIQFALERDLMTLFAAAMKNGRLTMTAKAKLVGALYDIELRFEAEMSLKNCYSLCVETSWAKQPETHHDYFRKTADSWFSFWTRDFLAANPPAADAGSPARYQKICASSLNSEAHLDTVPALQQAIVAAMKRGASFATSHKEGGSNIYWKNGSFAKTDYGDYPGHQNFTSDEEFLKFLRQFYDWETSKNIYPDKASDFAAWKLILRMLRTK